MNNLFATLLFLISLNVVNAQVVEPSDTVVQQSNPKDTNRYKIIKTDGGELNGEIIKQDNRELLLKTIDGREVYIPQHLISKIVKLSPLELNEKGLIQLVVIPHVGCEKFAEYICKQIAPQIEVNSNERVKLMSVEVREHSGNSAIYIND